MVATTQLLFLVAAIYGLDVYGKKFPALSYIQGNKSVYAGIPGNRVHKSAFSIVLMGEDVRSSMSKRVKLRGGPLRKMILMSYIVLMSHKPTRILPILKHPVTGSQH
jgi:hypothetical protein